MAREIGRDEFAKLTSGAGCDGGGSDGSGESEDGNGGGGSRTVLVDFWAPWCGPCRMLGRLLDEMSGELAEMKIDVVKVNVDDEQELAAECGVDSIPQVNVYRGGRMIATKKGLPTKSELLKLVGE